MSRIESIFSTLKEQNRKALITYIVCGDPDNLTTLEAMEYMAERGVDIIEIGVPFSDPMAEGPSIQRGHERSLLNSTSLEGILDLVGNFRKKNKEVGIVLMGYMNNFESMGAKEFSLKASNRGVDGIIVVDMPPEESNEFTEQTKEKDIDIIRLIAPTTKKERIKEICISASGFIYYISLKGTTGSEKFNPKDVKKNIRQLNEISSLPVVIGFGLKDRDTVRSVKDLSDGVVIGSALVDILGKNGFGQEFKEKIDELYTALVD